MFYAVIMAGGTGTRFWPLSTKNHPKQCLSILSEKPLIQDTVERLYPIFGKDNIYIATNQDIKYHIQRVLSEANFIIEPFAKNTTGCIGLACIELIKKDPEAIIFIETADHIYEDLPKYFQTIREALELAKDNKIVTIGIKPDHAATRFGYIKKGEPYNSAFKVSSFREKPNKETAELFLEDGNYYWNSGMYIFKAKKMLEEIQIYQPEIYQILLNIYNGANLEEEFQKLPSIAIDYAVSEKSQDLVVLPADIPWDDLGKLDILAKINPSNREGNVVFGRHVGVDSTGNIIHSDKLITTVGVKDLLIIQTANTTFICPKDRADDVKKIVQRLEREGKHEYL